MASGFSDLSLGNSDKAKVKLPKGFGSSDVVSTVVELVTNNKLGDSSIYLEMFNKSGSAEVLTKKTVKNFLKYVKRDLYDNSIFHRSVPGFVLQGGGFLAPDLPTNEGGPPERITPFKTIKNQPGNSNLRGTIAMAKQAGGPDSATSQWFVNLVDNFPLDEQNEGFTVFGKVLGQGMEIIDQLSSANIYNFGGAFSQLPLWQLEEADDGTAVITPEDFLIVASAEKLKTKKQPFLLNVESSDESLVEVRVTKKQQIKNKASDEASGLAEITVEAVSLVDGSVDVDSFDVVIGAPAQTLAKGSPAQRHRKPVDVFVGAGSFDAPYYRFFDSDGDEIENFKIKVKKKFHFHRLDGAETHPFYISDSGYNSSASDSLKVKGDGGETDGITGSDVLKFRVRKSDRKEFKQSGELFYFCTSHPSMIGSFSIKGQKSIQPLEPVQETVMEPVTSDPVGNDFSAYYRISMDPTDQLPLI